MIHRNLLCDLGLSDKEPEKPDHVYPVPGWYFHKGAGYFRMTDIGLFALTEQGLIRCENGTDYESMEPCSAPSLLEFLFWRVRDLFIDVINIDLSLSDLAEDVESIEDHLGLNEESEEEEVT